MRCSPYARVLGARSSRLHPALQSYFDTLPTGSIGIGEGTFARVGTPRRWLRPFLEPLQRLGVVYAGWASDVPFRIENRVVGGRLVSERRFVLPSGEWTMRDTVGLNRAGRLVDEIGRGGAGSVVASFNLETVDGELRLASRTVGIRLGRRTLRVPRRLAPLVRLRERFDGAVGLQRVDVTIDLPIIGRVYEYGGTFRYRIEEGA